MREDNFTQTVRMYRKEIFKYCMKHLNNNIPLVDEVISDVFKVLFEKWDTLDKDDNIRAYLYRVADNCQKDRLRKYTEYYTKNISLDEYIGNLGRDELSVNDSYFKELELERADEIEEIISKLTEGEKELFILRYREKKTLEEITETTSIPYSTLRYRLKKLRSKIEKEVHKLFE